MKSTQQDRPWCHDARQYTLLEYANLKQTCPHGIYISLQPGDHTQWHGVLFVRKGPYAPAVLRFRITFPSDYPYLPPIITFISDIFHPLVTPLTTYTYTTGSSSSDTVSATDEERLPPGGFSLRHGFPHWFGRVQKGGLSSGISSRQVSDAYEPLDNFDDTRPISLHDEATPGPGAKSSASASPPRPAIQRLIPRDPYQERRAGIVDILKYVRRAFTDESSLDNLPLEAAGNEGAWKAWRAHRVNQGAMTTLTAKTEIQHDEWNWDGVWEERVKKGIDASISESVLFGGATEGDDLIHFTPRDDTILERVKPISNDNPSKE